MQDLTGWQFRDVDLLVGVSDISGVGDHLGVDDGEDSFDTDGIPGEHESLEHVNLGSSDLIISILFVPGSVFVKPVVGLGLGIEWVAEVRGSRWGQPVSWSLSDEQIINQFLIFPLRIILEDSKASSLSA